MATSTQQPTAAAPLDVEDLRGKVQHMYEAVARHPQDGQFHFEMGRALAERLGYPAGDLDRVPTPAIESFAGVGFYFDLAALQPGERVVDLGSGSGMDAFIAALHVGETGRVIGIDMTEAQRDKAGELARQAGFAHAEFRPGLIEEIPLTAGDADCVISNGVINLCPDKARVFAEAARVLRPGGRLAIADIVTDRPLPANVTCNATLWAACIGGAAQQDAYRAAIETAGLRVVSIRENSAYAFLSKSAQNASRDYGVKSISLLAVKGAAR
jgi:ubiquinone/menaquinone biosynthesis C-methylase UbiE